MAARPEVFRPTLARAHVHSDPADRLGRDVDVRLTLARHCRAAGVGEQLVDRRG